MIKSALDLPVGIEVKYGDYIGKVIENNIAVSEQTLSEHDLDEDTPYATILDVVPNEKFYINISIEWDDEVKDAEDKNLLSIDDKNVSTFLFEPSNEIVKNLEVFKDVDNSPGLISSW